MSDTPTLPSPVDKGHILIVDDEPIVRNAYGRLLRRAGYRVQLVGSGHEAGIAQGQQAFDVVLSDIRMPGIGGVEVLRLMHRRNPDLPVILMTGSADLSTAIHAVEHGAFRYLMKPISPEELESSVESAVTKRRRTRLNGEVAAQLVLAVRDEQERSTAAVACLNRAFHGLYMVYQPIIRWSDRSVLAHEALVRTSEPKLLRPDDLIRSAESFGRLYELGRAVRCRVAEAIRSLPSAGRFFVNLHPCDLEDEELFSTDAPLSSVAEQVVLEITERASLHRIGDLQGRLRQLRELGYQIAIDDLGAGYAGLSAFAELNPEVVKLDMSLIRGIDGQPTKQKLVYSMVQLCDGLGVQVVAEGVETREERDFLIAAGCDLLQGFYFARPSVSLWTPPGQSLQASEPCPSAVRAPAHTALS